MKLELSLLLTALLTASHTFAGNWPQFRGPDSNGIANGATPPLTWSETENIKWKIQIPGRGHSSPVIKGDYIYLTTAIEENVRKEQYGNNICFYADRITLMALCIDFNDGRIKWQTELSKIEKPDPVHTLNSFATPTPVVDDERLYCDFGTYGTVCVNTKDGKILWNKRLPIDHEVGPGSSTALYKDLLILIRDGRDLRYITALNKTTGEEVWKTDRPPVEGNRTDAHKSFSSPIIFEADGKTQLVAPCAQWIASYDPATGKEYWRINHGKGFSLAAQPSVANGMIYYCTGFSGNQVLAVLYNGTGNVTKTHIAWESKKFAPTIPSQIVAGNRIYWIQDSGVTCASDAMTGALIWNKKLPGKYLSAPILSGNRIFLTNQAGQTTVIEAANEFNSLATNTLSGGDFQATPAFVDKSIIMRSDKDLYRIE